VHGADAAEMLAKAESLVQDNPFLEFRLDYLKQPAASFARFRDFVELHPGVALIGTCRREANGGKFRGTVSAQLEVLLTAAAAGFPLVDLELQSAKSARRSELEKLRSATALILSFHDFRATEKLEETFRAMQAIAADCYKIVATAASLHDNVKMMKFLEEKSQTQSVVGLCMGEQGIISRLLGLRAGSHFTFAASGEGEETAPGQMTARQLREMFRVEQIDAATKVYGVAGDPVAHSLSPLMMNTAFRRENLNSVYLPLNAKSLDDLMACARDIPLSGFSVTMPYKEAILRYLDKTDSLTEKVGACNTVIRAQDGRFLGFNTDVAGLQAALEQRLILAETKALVIGAGGAARAAVFGLKARNAEVLITNRTAANAEKLAQKAKIRFVKRANLRRYAFDLVINATPAGLESGSPEKDESPLEADEIKARFALDMVYTRLETPFTKAAKKAGAQIISGAEMFVHQGARQFELWTHKPAPVPEMLNTVARALAARKE
jgi:3-dehydroquinate dehydratase/shikimate dehydrogenase